MLILLIQEVELQNDRDVLQVLNIAQGIHMRGRLELAGRVV